MSKVRKVILVILTVMALMVIGAYAFLQAQLNKIQRIQIDNTVYLDETFDEDLNEEGTILDSDITFGQVLQHVQDVEGVTNILLVGQDTRVEGERARSDSMIILTINTIEDRLSMVSLMRDLYVQIPGYSNNKLNAAYRFGGFELLNATIEENFGITIDHDVSVDFSGFAEIVDALGGIDVELNQAEVDYLSQTSSTGRRYSDVKAEGLVVGTNHLDGITALTYARIRHVNTNDSHDDYGRTERQRIVLQTIYKQLKDEPFTNLLGIYSSLAGAVSTDMTNDEIATLGLAGYSMNVNEIDEYRIPADGTFSNQRISGRGDVLVIDDWDEVRNDLHTFIYGSNLDADAVVGEGND